MEKWPSEVCFFPAFHTKLFSFVVSQVYFVLGATALYLEGFSAYNTELTPNNIINNNNNNRHSIVEYNDIRLVSTVGWLYSNRFF